MIEIIAFSNGEIAIFYLARKSEKGGENMKLSARNQVKGEVKGVKEGPVSTEVVISTNGINIVSSITTTSAKEMNLKVGDEAYAIIKASSVMVAKKD